VKDRSSAHVWPGVGTICHTPRRPPGLNIKNWHPLATLHWKQRKNVSKMTIITYIMFAHSTALRPTFFAHHFITPHVRTDPTHTSEANTTSFTTQLYRRWNEVNTTLPRSTVKRSKHPLGHNEEVRTHHTVRGGSGRNSETRILEIDSSRSNALSTRDLCWAFTWLHSMQLVVNKHNN
jgi:hypothetical protein